MRLLAASLILANALWGDDPLRPESRPAGSAEVSEMQEYTQALSKQWLNRAFKIDIDAIGWSLKQRARGYSEVNLERATPGSEGGGGGPLGQEPMLYALSMRLEQYDDILRIARDPRDIPFALMLDASGRFLGGMPLETRLFLPLSWKDELRAEAILPLPDVHAAALYSWLNAAGLSSRWAIKSAYTNRLGLSTLQAGLGTQWLQLWTLQYDYRVRFGQGTGDDSHWLKLGREF